MKKQTLFLVMILGLLIAWPLQAQPKHHIGIIGGLNLANLSSDDLEEEGFDFSNRMAYGFGAVLDLGLSEDMSVRFEPMYLQKGSKFPDIEAPNVELRVKTAYLEIPLFFKYAFGSGITRPYLMVGPSLGFLLSAKLAVEGEEDEDIKDEIKDRDFSVGFGGGVSFPAGKSTLFVEGRYVLGLTNINEDDPTIEIKTRGIQVMASILFPLGGE